MGASVLSNVFFILLCCALRISADKLEEQHRSVHRHAVKTIRSPDGDIIDCIPPSKQLAFHHPLLKHHKLQEAPANISHRTASHNEQGYKVLQLWHQSGRCPNGTIPVRRISAHEISRTSSSLPQYASKYYGDPQIIGGVDHQHSFGSVSTESYYGTQAIFSLWDPSVELESEFSLAQLWILTTQSPSLNSLEAGWQVFPGKYLDNNPRLFVYWTSGNYQSGTGCYNLDCSGFIQTSSNILVGGTLSPVSTINGPQEEITLSVFKDPGTGNWWLEFNGESVGYWPQALSYLTSNYADNLQWGGEIINSKKNGQHTKTQMGSGNFAEDGYQKAAYIRNLQWFDVQKNLFIVSNLQEEAEDPTCYNIMTPSVDNSWGTYFFFGGPGQNPNCP